jgi:hypothetical protein
MSTTVTTNITDPLSVDVVEDYMNDDINTVRSFTELKTTYVSRLGIEELQLTATSVHLTNQVNTDSANISKNTARLTEINSILTDVNNL